MNSQTIIQALIEDQLIRNAKMQAYSGNIDNISMLVCVATGLVIDYAVLHSVMTELRNNPDLY